MTHLIRPATVADAPALVAGNLGLALETEDHHLDPETVLAGVRAVLDNPAKGCYLVAEQAGAVVGQVMVTREWSDWRNGWLWWIQSVWVTPAERGNGVFRALFEAVLARAREAGDVVGVRLYVAQGNHRAQAVYRRLGMVHEGYELWRLDREL